MSRKRPDVADLLRRASLRRTPVRVGVIELLAKSTEPMGVPEMLEHLPRDTDAVTVYRTLNTFTRKRLVHRVRGEDQTWRYALSTGADERASQHQHPHFVCEGCGAVQCLEEAKVPAKLLATMRIAHGYDVTYAEVVLHGTCPRCR